MTNIENDLTIYFDGACPLCRAEIAHYKRQKGSGKLRFVDVSKEADTGDDLTRDAALRRFHVRRADGQLLSGARGFREVWAALPRWRWAARLARLPGVTPLLELAYRGFLPMRPLLARLVFRLSRG